MSPLGLLLFCDIELEYFSTVENRDVIPSKGLRFISSDCRPIRMEEFNRGIEGMCEKSFISVNHIFIMPSNNNCKTIISF